MNAITNGLNRQRIWLAAGALLGVVLVGSLTAFGAVAGSPLSSLMISDPSQPRMAVSAPDYPVNDSGRTYGVSLDHAMDYEPDLILVVATNGREGYVEKTLLDELIGTNVATIEEALEWQEGAYARGRQGSAFIPVYESDGKTSIGQFEISYSGRAEILPPSADSK